MFPVDLGEQAVNGPTFHDSRLGGRHRRPDSLDALVHLALDVGGCVPVNEKRGLPDCRQALFRLIYAAEDFMGVLP